MLDPQQYLLLISWGGCRTGGRSSVDSQGWTHQLLVVIVSRSATCGEPSTVSARNVLLRVPMPSIETA